MNVFFYSRNPVIGLAKKQRRARLANPQKSGSPWTGNRKLKKRKRRNCLRYELLNRCSGRAVEYNLFEI